MATRVLQFGTSRFLQAHADLFIHEASASGQDIGPITVVKTTQGAERAGRIAAFADPAGFPVRIRGLSGGHVVDAEVRVKSVALAYDAYLNWDQLQDRFSCQTEVVICNTAEAGYTVPEQDRQPSTATGSVPSSFPAKLLRLLVCRHRSNPAPLLILPCELIVNNGQYLRGILSDLAADWGLGAGFLEWFARDVTICDTLVDRIVSEALEPIGAIAEPYALWAIRRSPGMVEPFQHPNVVYTENLETYTRLKLHILNLGHTWLAELWRSTGRAPNETVREILSDAAVRNALLSLYRDEVVPGFAAHELRAEATRYIAQTIERFDNPFLNHRISDIAQNHAPKIQSRVGDFLSWVASAEPSLTLPRLRQLAGSV
ncbi:MAG: D-mannonate oxidoreductase [Cereibacter sphaeroides]|uniref:D-mannonate oxidoreductase n=1 Tax=Cereibacter sphaeroides TaxID=1063 RepID=A0A2W5RV94_CERSP|nr:MAG: D-mannonate oxidoreductase [Cereibacter sphaeroides]